MALQTKLYSSINSKKMATLSEDYTFKKPLTFFLQVNAQYNEDGELIAFPVKVADLEISLV